MGSRSSVEEAKVDAQRLALLEGLRMKVKHDFAEIGNAKLLDSCPAGWYFQYFAGWYFERHCPKEEMLHLLRQLCVDLARAVPKTEFYLGADDYGWFVRAAFPAKYSLTRALKTLSDYDVAYLDYDKGKVSTTVTVTVPTASISPTQSSNESLH